MNRNRRTSPLYLAVSILLTPLFTAPSASAATNDHPACTAEVLRTADMFNCVPSTDGLPPLEFGEALTYHDASARQAFPNRWNQYGYDQRHNPVFPVAQDAPAFLSKGTFWAAPLTGLDFVEAQEAVTGFGNPESWASRTGQFLGTVMGVSSANGIIYTQLGRHEIFALDAESGKPVWRVNLVNVAGMGQAVIDDLGGNPVVYVPVGDAAFNVQNTVDFYNNRPHDRGAGFSGIYALDGLTGEQLWRYDTKGAARPAPIFKDGRLYVATSGGELFVLDAATGSELGSFTNPGEGFPGLASPNWYETTAGRRFVLYGTIRPRRILAVDVTDPTAPTLGWEFSPPNATANAPGDTPVAVDPELGMLYTTVFSSINGTFNLQVMAIDATTGTLVWSRLGGEGDSPPGYKGSVPMVHNSKLYVGNTIAGTFQSYDAKTGELRWSTSLAGPNDPPTEVHRPRGAAVYYDGKIIHASAQRIRTFDPDTGEILNDFGTPGVFSVFGVTQPLIVGKQMYLSAISGWVFAVPVDFITTSPGFSTEPVKPEHLALAPRVPEFINTKATPTKKDAGLFPSTWLSYAGGQDHNAVVDDGPKDIQWQTALNEALPLDAAPLDEQLLGSELATQMTHFSFGVGSGLAAANGIIYAGSDRFSINAVNARSGELIWRFRTFNANFGQPLVTPNTVIVGGGDPWLNLGSTGSFKRNDPATTIGASLQHLHGLDPKTGLEKWTYYSGPGTSGMTPLYHGGNLYWINGQGKAFAITAETGEPVAPFMDDAGKPVLNLGGFNAISSANIYHQPAGSALMIVGTAMPNKISAIDLTTAQVIWTQVLPDFATYVTGFAAVSPAVDQAHGWIISTVLVDADPVADSATVLAFALDASTGTVVWTQPIGSGPIPGGFTGPTPVVDGNNVYLANPLDKTVIALNTTDGTIQWQTPVEIASGRLSWGPGVVVENKLIQPIGSELYAFNINNGSVMNQLPVGGAFTYNNPVVIGKTLYIGNSWGWVMAFPLDTVTGDNIQ